jgi:hypothetical protein
MKCIRLFVTVIFISSILFSGCKKYDEGPKFTLRSVKNRLTNGPWKLQELTKDGADVTASYKEIDFEYNFDATGGLGTSTTYSQSYTYIGQLNKVSGAVLFFDNDIMEMTVTYSNGSSSAPNVFSYDSNYESPSWKIKKLTNKEFWLETRVDNEFYSMKLTKDK